MSQTEAIKSALQAGDKLTPIDALTRFGCFRLSARIHQLRKEGLNIKSKPVATPSGKHVAEYSLIS